MSKLELSEADLREAIAMYVEENYPNWHGKRVNLTWHASEGLVFPSISLTVEAV